MSNGERKLIKFDLTREDIPPLDGHDWMTETPYVASMANENLRVACELHPGRFGDVLSLACLMLEKANPGMRAAQTDFVYDSGGNPIECTVYPVLPEAATISATCVNCGRLARDENYWSRMPDGEILYWADLCVHEYEPGGLVTCDCGMLCPHCQTPEQRDAQRKSGEWELSNSSTIAPRGFKGILLVEMEAQGEDEEAV